MDSLEQGLLWVNRGQGVALATVIATWGSSPRPVGSHMAISASGEVVGSVSGGCIEGAVIHEAKRVIEEKIPTQLHFGVTDEQAWEVGLTCGGEVTVYVEPLGQNVQRLLDCRTQGKAAVLVRDLSRHQQSVVTHEGVWGEIALTEKRQQYLLQQAESHFLEEEGWFVHVFSLPRRLIVVGAVHITQTLAPMAQMVGYQVYVIDPRRTFATADRFPDLPLYHEWPEEIMPSLALDDRTAVAALTHDPKLDDPALRIALASTVFYIGALGSRRTHAKRLHRLQDVQGVDRIHAPIGLPIGSRTPAEIALSILAQIVESQTKEKACT